MGQATLSYSYFQKDLNLNVGFDGPEQRADHFGFGRGSTVCYRGIDFFHDRSAWCKLVEWSSDYHQHVGFLVFCDLGIALTGFHDDDEDDLAVTVFPRVHGKSLATNSKFSLFHQAPNYLLQLSRKPSARLARWLRVRYNYRSRSQLRAGN